MHEVLRATGRLRDELIGAFMFDAFPDDPADATATGVRNLTASLERVLRLGAPDDMGIQRYDIPEPGAFGAFRRKAWNPVDSPWPPTAASWAPCTTSRT
ncbi:hypothetical protein ACFYXC_20685 [Streptomyces sp. NPDC002701]|uniref:hypothetical protein n=1 Tax=Streptomyces sp. NPDC002701 TaxID=3364661 RepID=UPI0036CD3605